MTQSTQKTGRELEENACKLVLDILYGLAISNGLANAIPTIVGNIRDGKSWVLEVAITVMAFSLAVGDYLTYVLYLREARRRNAFRLLLDVLTPVLAFVMFACHAYPQGAVWCVAIYFWGAVLYSASLAWDGNPVDKWYQRCSTLLAVMCVVVPANLFFSWSRNEWLPEIAFATCIVISAVYTIFNFYKINQRIRKAWRHREEPAHVWCETLATEERREERSSSHPIPTPVTGVGHSQ